MKRALLLAAPAVLTLGLVACAGDDDDDTPETTATAETTADATTDVTTEDTSEDTSDATVTDETTDDTRDTLLPGGTALPGGTLVPGGTILPGGSLPEISIPDISIPEASEIIGRIFPNLDEEQVECLADEVGTDIDVNRAMDVLDECNIDPADLQPGG
jgi:hypothetical protein